MEFACTKILQSSFYTIIFYGDGVYRALKWKKNDMVWTFYTWVHPFLCMKGVYVAVDMVLVVVLSFFILHFFCFLPVTILCILCHATVVLFKQFTFGQFFLYDGL